MNKKEKVKEYKKELLDIFLKAGENRNLLEEFLVDVLTPAEYEALALRWQIVKRLDKGETHRVVAGELGLGISTVTRGSRELRNKKGGFNLMLQKFNKKN